VGEAGAKVAIIFEKRINKQQKISKNLQKPQPEVLKSDKKAEGFPAFSYLIRNFAANYYNFSKNN
jgi:hypothetical protein